MKTLDEMNMCEALEIETKTIYEGPIPNNLPYNESGEDWDFTLFRIEDRVTKVFPEIDVKLACGWGYSISAFSLPDYWRISIDIVDPNNDFYDDIGGDVPYHLAEDEALEFIGGLIQGSILREENAQ